MNTRRIVWTGVTNEAGDLVSGVARVRLTQDSFTDDSIIVAGTTQFRLVSGEGEVTLWANEEGAVANEYAVKLPGQGGESFFTVPAGEGELDGLTLISDYAGPSDPNFGSLLVRSREMMAQLNVLEAPYYAERNADAGDTQTKLEAASADARDLGGAIVLFPEGQLNMNSIPTYSGVTMRGVSERSSILQVMSEDVDAIRAIGTVGWSPPVVQVTVEKLKIVGPGKASGSTGVGVAVEYGAVGIKLRDLWILSHGSHAVDFSNTYSAELDNVLMDNCGGDGLHAETNANNITAKNTLAISLGGAGYKLLGGATFLALNANAELCYLAGFDLRYVFAGRMLGCHMEGNGTDGASPNVYLHHRGSIGEPTTAYGIHGCLIQGSGVTQRGIDVDSATMTDIAGNWFSNHLTDHIRTTALASRTRIWPNSYAGTGTKLTDLSASTQILDIDATELLWRIKPGVKFDAVAAAGTGPIGTLFRSTSFGGHLRYRFDDGITRSLVGKLENAANLTFGTIPAFMTRDSVESIAISGAAIGDPVSIHYPAVLEDGLIPGGGRVVAAGLVKVRMANVTASPITPASAGYVAMAAKKQV